MELALIGIAAAAVLLWRNNVSNSPSTATIAQLKAQLPATGQKIVPKQPVKKPQAQQQQGKSTGGGGASPTGGAQQGASGQRGSNGCSFPYRVIDSNLCKVGCSCVACISQPCYGPAPCSGLSCIESQPCSQNVSNITDILQSPSGLPTLCTIDNYDACYIASGCSVEGGADTCWSGGGGYSGCSCFPDQLCY